MGTVYRIVPGFSSYLASDDGELWSCRLGAKRLLSGPLHHDGYRVYTVRDDAGRKRTINGHILIALSFCGPRPFPEAQIAHGDGDRANNRPANLRWATVKENMADRLLHGTHPGGERNPKAKLNTDQIIEIRRRYTGRRGQLSGLGREFGVNPSQIQKIVRNEQWRNVRT